MADTLERDLKQPGVDSFKKKSEGDLFLEMISTDLSTTKATLKYEFDFTSSTPLPPNSLGWTRASNMIPYQAESMQLVKEVKPRLTLKVDSKHERLSEHTKEGGFNESFSIFSCNNTASTFYDSTFSKSNVSQFGATLNDKSQKFSIFSNSNTSIFDASQLMARSICKETSNNLDECCD